MINMFFTKIVVIFSLLCFSSISFGEDISYLCIPTKATGFYYNKSTKEWTNSTFKVGDEKLLIKKKGSSWEWSKFGDKISHKTCGYRTDVEQVDCLTSGGDLTLNLKTLRYIQILLYGYIDGVDSNDNTPAITIGKCSPL